MPKMIEKLSPMHIRFIDEYVMTLNPQEAFVRAGFSDSNKESYSYTLLGIPIIRQEISRKLDALEYTSSDIKARYRQIVDGKESLDKDKLHGLDSLSKISGLMRPEQQQSVTIIQKADELVQTLVAQRLTPTQEDNKNDGEQGKS